jgi:tetratricopeptide (TPR) repeat protein
MQIEEAVYFLFTWMQGTFNFESDVRPEQQDFLVSINPESLLLEGARRVDEWSLIEKKIPSFDLIFEVDWTRLKASEVQLTDEQERLVSLLDGTRDVRHVVDESALGEFEVGKALYGLISAGFVHRVGQSHGVRTSIAGSAPVDEHRNLGMAFYRTGMLEESRREFRRVIELRPTDGSAYFYLGLVAIREAQWEAAAQHFVKALECGGPQASVYYNLALAYENAGQFEQAEEAYTDAAVNAPHDWRILTGWGIAALRGRDVEVAAARLERARQVAGKEPVGPLWYWARSLAAGASGEPEAAEAILREGLEQYPQHPVLRNNLSVMLETLGRPDEAIEILEAALLEDPWLPQLSKNLGDLQYQRGRFDHAWEAYQRAVKLQPDIGDDAYFKLGNIAYKRLDRSSAANFWRRALELNPQHELARTNLETLSALA